MHEAGIAQEIIRAALSAAPGREGLRILRVNVVVGSLSSVDPSSLRFAFEVLSAESEAMRGAELEIEETRPSCACKACGAGPFESVPFSCPACGSADMAVTGGDDLLIESIEVAD